jgi:hypothetical protein
MALVQLSIPFSNTLKLSDKHKCTLIASQSKRLGIEDWEIASLIQVCKAKGWISKGLALLYKYAGYIDELQEMLSKFHYHSEEIVNFASINRIETLGRLCLLIIRIYYTISSWRKIQFSPRPIFIEENGTQMPLSTFFASRIKKILEVTRKYSVEIWTELNSSLLKEVIINIFGDEIWKMNEESDLHGYNWLTNRHSTSTSNYIKNTILDIISLENNIYEHFQDSLQKWPINATLFLPYPEVKKTISSFNWFLSSFETYQKLSESLGNVIEETLLIHSSMNCVETISSVLANMQEERFKAFFSELPPSKIEGTVPLRNMTPFTLTEVMPLVLLSPQQALPLQTEGKSSDFALELMTPTQQSEENSTIKEETPSFMTDVGVNKVYNGKLKTVGSGSASESTVLQNVFSPKKGPSTPQQHPSVKEEKFSPVNIVKEISLNDRTKTPVVKTISHLITVSNIYSSFGCNFRRLFLL